jgi:UDP-N-acetyl-D-glucosamine dehydrogenase
VVIVTNHSSYDYVKMLEEAKLMVDTRNALGKMGRDNPKVVRL